MAIPFNVNSDEEDAKAALDHLCVELCEIVHRIQWTLQTLRNYQQVPRIEPRGGRGGRQQQQHHQAGTAPTVSSPSGEEASRLSADSLAMDPSRLTDAVANFAMMMPNAPGAFTELDAVLQQQPHGLTTGTRRRQRTSSESSCCECKTKSGHIDIENAEQWIQESTSEQTSESLFSKFVPASPFRGPIWTAVICVVGWHLLRTR